MLLARPLLALALSAGLLPAQEAPTPTPKSEAPGRPEKAVDRDGEGSKQTCSRFHHRHRGGGHVQGLMPLRDLKQALDGRTGFGVGLDWTHEHGEHHTGRTRLEWNVFPEGTPKETGVATYAKNYLLSFDHLIHPWGPRGLYLAGGLGGVRWIVESTPAGLPRESLHTTKLAFTGGLGFQFNEHVALEARYVASSIYRTLDAGTVQLALNWRF